MKYPVFISTILFFIGFVPLYAQQAGTIDSKFHPEVRLGTKFFVGISSLPEDKFLITGVFSYQSPAGVVDNIAKFHADGSLDTSFLFPLEQPFDIVIPEKNGNLLIGGFGDDLRYFIKRVFQDGSVDPGYNPADITFYLTPVLQPDGKLLVMDVNTKLLCRLNQDGTRDTSFNCDLIVDKAVVLPNGKIGVANGDTFGKLYLLNEDGSVDTQFQEVNVSCLEKIIALSSNQLLVSTLFELVRYNANGTLDSSFSPPSWVEKNDFLYELTNGDLLASGYDGTNMERFFIKLKQNGTLDTTFIPASHGNALSIQSDGKIIMAHLSEIIRLYPNGEMDSTFKFITRPDINGGKFGKDRNIYCYGIANSKGYLDRYDEYGQRDHSFKPDSLGNIITVEIEQDNSILTSGFYYDPFIRHSSSGERMLVFDKKPERMLLQDDGKILVIIDKKLLRLFPDGSEDPSYNASQIPFAINIFRGPFNSIYALAKNNENSDESHIIKLNSDGSSDPAFSCTLAYSTPFDEVFVQSTGKVIVAVKGNRPLMRFNADGTPDPGFNHPVLLASSDQLLLQPDDKILIGKGFAEKCVLYRINPDGDADNSFAEGVGEMPVYSPVFRSLSLTPEGQIMVMGTFTKFNGIVKDKMVMLNNKILTGIAENDRNFSMNLFPNPSAENNITLALNTDQPGRVEITLADIMGRLHYKKAHTISAGENRFIIKITDLPAGIYNCQVTAGENTSVQKFIKH